MRETGDPRSAHRVLCLPGALCTAVFYDDMASEPALAESSIRLIAATLPGFGGTTPPDDLSMENYAIMAAELAGDLSCEIVVGHSLGATVAIQMVVGAGFKGPVVLLSPSFSRTDESRFPRALDTMSLVLGHLPYSGMLKVIGPAMSSGLPPSRRQTLIAELKRNDPKFLRRQNHQYLRYLDRVGSLAPRLCASGIRAWVVFGDRDDVGLTEDERNALASCSQVDLVEIADAGHFTLNQQPGAIADLVVRAVSSQL